MTRSSADWVRSFAAQGMTRDEILELTGLTRPAVNNALNRANCEPWLQRFDLGELPRCTKCGALSFEQEPSRIGRGRHCSDCGAHYDYWSDRRIVPKPRPKATRKERCVRCARWFRAGDNALSCPKCTDDFRAAAKRAELFAAVEKKRADEAARAERKRHEAELAAEVDAGIAELLAELQRQATTAPATKTDRIRELLAKGVAKAEIMAQLGVTRQQVRYAEQPLKSAQPGYVRVHVGGAPRKKHCHECGSEPSKQHPDLAGRKKRGQRCWSCGAMECYWLLNDPDRTGSPLPPEPAETSQPVFSPISVEPTVEARQPTRSKSTQAVIDRHRAIGNGINLRELFETHAGGRISKELKQRKLQEAGDEWLRKHEAESELKLAELAPEAKEGVRSWSECAVVNLQRDTTDYRAELLAAARAGDEHAQWRASELFGMEFSKEARCAS